MDGLLYSDSFKLHIAIEILKEKPFLIKGWKMQFIELVENILEMKNLEIKYLKNQLITSYYY